MALQFAHRLGTPTLRALSLSQNQRYVVLSKRHLQRCDNFRKSFLAPGRRCNSPRVLVRKIDRLSSSRARRIALRAFRIIPDSIH